METHDSHAPEPALYAMPAGVGGKRHYDRSLDCRSPVLPQRLLYNRASTGIIGGPLP